MCGGGTATQTNETEPRTELHKYAQWIFDKGAKAIH